MAIGTGLAIAGGVLGAIGSKKQADAQKKAAAQAAEAAKFRPYGVSGAFGNVSWDPSGQQVRGSYSPEMEAYRGLFGNQMQQYFGGGGPNAGFQQFAQGVGSDLIPQLFGQSLSQAGDIPYDAYNAYGQQLNQLGQQAGDIYGMQNNLFGQAAGIAGRDVSGMVNDRLGLLRQQAQPYEQRALDMVAQSAFNRGQLGGPGGRQALSEFGDSITRADLGRQLAAQDLGLQAQNQNQNMAGLFAQLGGQVGQSGLATLGFQGNAAGQQFGNALQMSELGNIRAQQRLQNAQGLFGFGNDLTRQDYDMGQGAWANLQGMDEGMRNWIALGGNIGGQASQAGANQGQFLAQRGTSPSGAFLGSLGSGLFGQAMAPRTGASSFNDGLSPINTGARYISGPKPASGFTGAIPGISPFPTW